MPVITYKGKTIESKHYCELSDEQFNQLRTDYYRKPDIQEVKREIQKINGGGIKQLQ